MSSIVVELELAGTQWIGKACGPRGAAEIKTNDLDDALEQIRAACVRFGAPVDPLPPPVPIEMPAPEPRFARHSRPAETEAGADQPE
jgi:hypothetical protein